MGDVRSRDIASKLTGEKQTGDALLQTSFLLLTTDAPKKRVEDGVHAVRIAWGTGEVRVLKHHAS